MEGPAPAPDAVHHAPPTRTVRVVDERASAGVEEAAAEAEASHGHSHEHAHADHDHDEAALAEDDADDDPAHRVVLPGDVAELVPGMTVRTARQC